MDVVTTALSDNSHIWMISFMLHFVSRHFSSTLQGRQELPLSSDSFSAAINLLWFAFPNRMALITLVFICWSERSFMIADNLTYTWVLNNPCIHFCLMWIIKKKCLKYMVYLWVCSNSINVAGRQWKKIHINSSQRMRMEADRRKEQILEASVQMGKGSGHRKLMPY